MKIVVLDGYTLNPGDLSWDMLRLLGEVEIYDRTPRIEAVSRAGNAEIVLTNKTLLLAEEIEQLHNVKYIGVLATGYNIVDIEAARNKGIVVTNVPAYSTMSVAQHVFALMLEFFNTTGALSESVRQGRWSRSVDFSYWDRPLTEISGLTLGIIGYGRIGRMVARIAEAFNMNILVSDVVKPEEYKNHSLDEVMTHSDVVTLHCPLTPETKGMISAPRLKLMKPSSLLINTARGPLINENDLAEALNSGQIAGAALDVLSVEPPAGDNPLLHARNCIITPHVAWASFEARKRLMEISVENVRGFIEGKPSNVVN